MKRILIVICILASIGSIFAQDRWDEVPGAYRGFCNERDQAGNCIQRCRYTIFGILCWEGTEGSNVAKGIDDRSWFKYLKSVECKTNEHCCVKFSAGLGCAKCCPK